MADLEQTATLLNVSLPKVVGKKRRSWLIDENEKYIKNHKDKLDSGLDSGLDSLDSGLDSGLDSLDSGLDSGLDSLDSGLDSNLDSALDSNLDSALDSSKIKYYLNLLTGRQLEIFSYILKICMKNGELITGPIHTSTMAATINTSYGTTKDALNKLIKKGMLIRLKGKTSSQGFITLCLTKEIKSSAIELKLDSVLDSNLDSVLDSKPSPNNNNNNNINNNYYYTLPEEWKNIDCEPVREIGFSETHLVQLHKNNWNTPEIIQESIYQFAFALETPEKLELYVKKTPLKALFGVLKKGGGWTTDNYETAEIRALKKYAEQKKKEAEIMDNIYKEHFDLEYNSWFKNLSDEELKHLLPEANFRHGRYTNDIQIAAQNVFRYSKWRTIHEDLKKATKDSL